ncbi:MAG: hypothetical protein HC830_13915 [Bacteroidetes bacterium]|nr:hypothetical protein [Bacteroidota bacterium]
MITPRKEFRTGNGVPSAGNGKGEAFVADDPSKIQVGMQVLHERFGVGKVIELEGKFPDIKSNSVFW